MNRFTKLIFSTFVAVMIALTAHADKAPPKRKALWQSWKDVNDGYKAERKPILIDIYTTWCYYCKVMDATTYKNDSVSNYLDKNFYRFKFNAETHDTITWNEKSYAYNNRYGVHDFAVYLTRGSIVYPTTVIISPDGQPYYQFGALKVSELEMLLKYFNEVRDKKISLEEYGKTFHSYWK